MATNITMPQLGLTMTEGTVTTWFKKEGDTVKTGEVVVEISTDKISNQIEAKADGTLLQILVPEGEDAPVKAVLGVIGEQGEKVAAQEAAATEEATPSKQETREEQHEVKATGGWVKASPAAKKLARDHGVDLAMVTATGPEGRVVERDVQSYLAEQETVKASPLASKVAAEFGVDLTDIKKDGRIMKDDVLAVLPQASAEAATSKPLTGIRKVIAERMGKSWSVVPHVHYNFEIDMIKVTELRKQITEAAGTKLSFTDFIVKCAAQVLMEYKIVNSSLIDGKVVEHDDANIGIAVAVDNGLIVPVVRKVQQKSLRTIREEISSLGAKARQGSLMPDDMVGGTFTVSNLGMYGVDTFSPIVNQPESAILGVCRIVKKPVVVNDEITIRPMMMLCLGADHRLIDGAVAAQFVRRMKELLENPLTMLA